MRTHFVIIFVLILVNCCFKFNATIIDTQKDLHLAVGWTANCTNGYQDKVTDFLCTSPWGISVSIDFPKSGNREGFWAGCESDCTIAYQVQSRDANLTIVSYKEGNTGIKVYRDRELIGYPGNRWSNITFTVEAGNVSKQSYSFRMFTLSLKLLS